MTTRKMKKSSAPGNDDVQDWRNAKNLFNNTHSRVIMDRLPFQLRLEVPSNEFNPSPLYIQKLAVDALKRFRLRSARIAIRFSWYLRALDSNTGQWYFRLFHSSAQTQFIESSDVNVDDAKSIRRFQERIRLSNYMARIRNFGLAYEGSDTRFVGVAGFTFIINAS